MSGHAHPSIVLKTFGWWYRTETLLTRVGQELIDGPETGVLDVVVGREAEPQVPAQRRDDRRKCPSAVLSQQIRISVGSVPYFQEIVEASVIGLDVEHVAKVYADHVARFGCNISIIDTTGSKMEKNKYLKWRENSRLWPGSLPDSRASRILVCAACPQRNCSSAHLLATSQRVRSEIAPLGRHYSPSHLLFVKSKCYCALLLLYVCRPVSKTTEWK